MAGLRGEGAKLTLAMLMTAAGPTFATEVAVPKSTVAAPVVSPPAFVPTDFRLPVLVEGPGFKLVPLGPDLVKVDFDAYMSSIEHLQKTFSRSADWPHQGISDADAMQDMQNEQGRFRNRKSFAYSVLTPDGRRERGSVYVSPSTVKGYDAVVRLWVTKAEYDAGFDAELYRWVTAWVKSDWPFKKIAYPGRAIEWATWDAAVAESKAAAAASKEHKP